ncbi:MAG: zf-HC2 domain-containing protein [Myxococcota bacterium]
MNCEDAQLFIDAYVDGEFEERERTEFELHLEDCESCRRQVEGRVRVKECLKSACGHEKAPAELRSRIMGELQKTAGEESGGDSRGTMWRYAAAAIPLAAAVALVMVVFTPDFLTVKQSTAEQVNHPPAVENTVEWHRGDFPVEVPGPVSGDVSRWFRGKVDFPVRLPAFQTESVRLVGGRLANVDQQRAAYALYDVGGSRLSVMMSHDEHTKFPTQNIQQIQGHDVAFINVRGYEVAVLRNNGITYTMTSDVSHDELVDLVHNALEKE